MPLTNKQVKKLEILRRIDQSIETDKWPERQNVESLSGMLREMLDGKTPKIYDYDTLRIAWIACQKVLDWIPHEENHLVTYDRNSMHERFLEIEHE